MDFNDEPLLTPESYGQIAKAYKQALKDKGFVFVAFDKSDNESALKEVFDTIWLLHDNLFALGGFLGTGAMFNLNEKQILALQNMFEYNYERKKAKLYGDKTKLFLNMLSLENILINKLLCLALSSDKFEQIVNIIKERTALSGSLYKINGIISAFFQ